MCVPARPLSTTLVVLSMVGCSPLELDVLSRDGEVSSGGATQLETQEGIGGVGEATNFDEPAIVSEEAEGSAGAPNLSDAPPPSVEVTDNAYCESVANWDPAWVEMELRTMMLINAHRQAGADCGSTSYIATESLVRSAAIRCATRVHALDMAERSYVSVGTWNPAGAICTSAMDCEVGESCQGEFPTSAEQRCGEGISVKLQQAEYEGQLSAYLVQAGWQTAEGVVGDWMDDPGACAMLMDPSLNEIGVGYAWGGYADTVWTLLLGSSQ